MRLGLEELGGVQISRLHFGPYFSLSLDERVEPSRLFIPQLASLVVREPPGDGPGAG